MKYVILISGKKEAGKNTISSYIKDKYSHVFKDALPIIEVGFADELKKKVNELFGIPLKWMYGSNEDKNKKTHIKWSSLPNYESIIKERVYEAYQKSILSEGFVYQDIKFLELEIKKRYENEFLSVRELLQQFGTNICRRIDENCWVRACYNHIDKLSHKYVIVTDVRFPNEILFPSERRKVSVRLTRNIHNDNHLSETALDSFTNFDVIINNSGLSLEETFFEVDKRICEKYLKC